MTTLDYPDRHFAQAADGWLELGLVDDAELELARLSPAAAQHPDALELRWRISARRNDWPAALAAAQQMTQAAPERPEGWIHQSYTLHEMRRTEEAWSALLPLVDRFPKESIIPYNLACYACQMGDLTSARTWLERAVRRSSRKEIRSLALHDPDLAALREEIATW